MIERKINKQNGRSVQEMQRNAKNWWLLAGILIVGLNTGCPSDDGSGSELEGTINIDGSSTVYPITEAVASDFSKEYPKVKVPVAVSGTGGGFKRFVIGETEISDASRPIKAEEFKQAIENEVEFVEVPVAYDGLSVVVNPENNWVEQLTVDDLKKIFLDAEDKPTSWNQVNADWPEEPISLFIPGTDSGTFDYFKEIVVGKTENNIRADVNASEDDNVLVTGIANEKGGIGFFGSAYYFENSEKLKGVAIVNKDGEAVKPSPDSIESGAYNPLSRPLFIYINVDRISRPEMKKFVDFYMEHAGDKANAVGYVALPEEVYETARENVKNKHVGTAFLTEDGEKRSGSVVDLYKSDSLTATLK